MSVLATRADLRSVKSSAGESADRGAAIQRRVDALGISGHEFERITGIGRKTLARAIANGENVRSSTYDAIEANLEKLEGGSIPLARPETRPVGEPGDDLVEFTVEGNFGVRAVVKGPVRDIDALQAAVTKLIADMNSSQGGTEPRKS